MGSPAADQRRDHRAADRQAGPVVLPRFQPLDQEELAPSGARARFNANVAALRTLRTLEAEGRAASADERSVLARWGSWGAQGLSQVFDETRPQFETERHTLHGLLTESEYAAARRTTINAHYTDMAVAGEMWSAMQRLGLDGGEVLEPGCGSGVFVGRAPATVRMTGVELDPVTAAIAARLYPEARIRAESFADTRVPDGSFDAVIGNVPFADVTLHVRAERDTGTYPRGIKISDHEMKTLTAQHLTPHNWHGDWNYDINPTQTPS